MNFFNVKSLKLYLLTFEIFIHLQHITQHGCSKKSKLLYMKNLFWTIPLLWIFIPSKVVYFPTSVIQDEFCLAINLLLDERDEQYKTCFGEKINEKKYMCSKTLPGSMWGYAFDSDFPALSYVMFESENITKAISVYKDYVKQLKICLPDDGYYYTEEFKSKNEVSAFKFTAKGESTPVIRVKVSTETNDDFFVMIDFNS